MIWDKNLVKGSFIPFFSRKTVISAFIILSLLLLMVNVSKSIGLSNSITHVLLERLIERGLVLYVTDGEKYVPAKPSSEILLADALRVGFESCSAGLGSIDPALEELRQAQVQTLANRTMAPTQTH